MYNFDVPLFWTKYIRDIETSLGKGGRTYTGRKATLGIPCNIAPGKRLCQEARPDWGSAIVQLPWYMYVYYGDSEVIAEHYVHMKRWVNYLRDIAKDDIVYEGYGDWCPPGGNEKMACPVPLSSTAFYYFDVRILAQAAELLGRTTDAAVYRSLAKRIRRAFIDKFFDVQNQTYGSQTADALALYHALVPKAKASAVAETLAQNVTLEHGGHLNTGIHGSRHLYWALSYWGHDETAYGILTQQDYPSFGDLFARGASTIWETWMPPGQHYGGSLNHPMQGGFDAWFYCGIGGINPDSEEAGFKHIILRPELVRQLEWAEVHYKSIHGAIESRWQRRAGRFVWEITIPGNTGATVYVPAGQEATVMEGGQPAKFAEGVSYVGREDGWTIYEIGSGGYRFVCTEVERD